jgi:hypothetical protein
VLSPIHKHPFSFLFVLFTHHASCQCVIIRSGNSYAFGTCVSTLLVVFGESLNKDLFEKLVIKDFLPGNKLFKEAHRISSMTDYLVFKRVLDKRYLPEPLGMNAFSFVLGEQECRFRSSQSKVVRTYLHQYERILEFMQLSGETTMNVVVGPRHQRPLEYLLRAEVCS